MPGNLATNPLSALLSDLPPPSIGTAAVDKMLRAIRDHLGMDVAFVSEFRMSDRIFRHVDARGETPIHPGDAAPLERGYCQRVVDGRLPGLIPDTRLDPTAMALPETRAIPIGAHLSVPIRFADGKIYGTFCCFSFSPDRSLGERDLKMMEVLAIVLADQIERDLDGQRARAEKAGRINAALAAGQPSIAYQPIYNLSSGKLAGLECLSRFNVEPRRPPDVWFAEAAAVGMEVALDAAAIRAALRSLPDVPADVYLAINCSPRSVLDEGVQSLLLGADLHRVVLEITEHDYIEDYPAMLSALAPLRANGLRVAIDDAGAGYASLRHILQLQPDMIKLDISLSRNIDADPQRRALASALITFARELQARIVAEGVESAAELRTLKNLGAGKAQGYFLARPMSLVEALRQPFPSMPAEPHEGIANARRAAG